MSSGKVVRMKGREHVREALLSSALAQLPTQREQSEQARKFMLMGVDFALKMLGVDREGMMGNFIRQEFQAWVKDVEAQTFGRAAAKKRPTGAAMNCPRAADQSV